MPFPAIHPSNRSLSDGTDQLLPTQHALVVGTCIGRAEKDETRVAFSYRWDSDGQAKRIRSIDSFAAFAAYFIRQALVLGSQGNEE